MRKKLLALALGVFSFGLVLGQVNFFPDVPNHQWFYTYVMQVKDWGVIDGNDDGTFAPERNINRAEFSKMLVRYDARVDEKLVGLSTSSAESLPSVMHLDRHHNQIPSDCPESWQELTYGRIYEDDDNMNRRTCLTTQRCQVMNLRDRDKDPTACPMGWNEADFGEINSKDSQRVCFICQS